MQKICSGRGWSIDYVRVVNKRTFHLTLLECLNRVKDPIVNSVTMASTQAEALPHDSKRDTPVDLHGQTLPSEKYLENEAALFASPLPIIGQRKTTTRVELWVSRRRCLS